MTQHRFMIIAILLFLGMITGAFIHDAYPEMNPYLLAGISFSPMFLAIGFVLIGSYKAVHEHLRSNTKINPFILPIAAIGMLVGILTGGVLIAFVAGAALVAITHVIGKVFSRLV